MRGKANDAILFWQICLSLKRLKRTLYIRSEFVNIRFNLIDLFDNKNEGKDWRPNYLSLFWQLKGKYLPKNIFWEIVETAKFPSNWELIMKNSWKLFKCFKFSSCLYFFFDIILIEKLKLRSAWAEKVLTVTKNDVIIFFESTYLKNA